MNDNDILYTVSEAAKILKIGKNLMYELVKARIIPVLKLGSYKIRKSSLERFVEEYEGYDFSNLSNITMLDAG